MLLLNSMNSEHINKLDAETLELLTEAAHKVWMEGKPVMAGSMVRSRIRLVKYIAVSFLIAR